nr:MAG TPA: hypothetical protein [Caudoviricetes sp.]
MLYRLLEIMPCKKKFILHVYYISGVYILT